MIDNFLEPYDDKFNKFLYKEYSDRDLSLLQGATGRITIEFTWFRYIRPLIEYALNNNTFKLNTEILTGIRENELRYGKPSSVSKYFGRLCGGVHVVPNENIQQDTKERIEFISNSIKKYKNKEGVTGENLSITRCILGNKPITDYYYHDSINPIIRICVHQHEKIHQRQCREEYREELYNRKQMLHHLR